MMVNARQQIQEMRPSPRVVVVMLLFSAFVLVWVDDVWPEPNKRLRVQQFELLLYGMSAAILMFHYWKPQLSRYVTVAIFVFLLNLSVLWLRTADLLLLMPLAVAVAAALLGLVPATLTTGGQALLLFGLTRYVDPELSFTPVVMTVVAMIGTLGVMFAIYRPTYQMAGRATP
jgi:heme A synthase